MNEPIEIGEEVLIQRLGVEGERELMKRLERDIDLLSPTDALLLRQGYTLTIDPDGIKTFTAPDLPPLGDHMHPLLDP